MPLSELDQNLLDHCIDKRPFAWESFVDRYLMLVLYTVKQTATMRRIRLTEADEQELANDVFLTILKDDFAVLRRFQRQSSLAAYITVIARRVIIRKLIRQDRDRQRAAMRRTYGE